MRTTTDNTAKTTVVVITYSGWGLFGDNHKVKLGKNRSKTNGVKLSKMASGLWVSPGAIPDRLQYVNKPASEAELAAIRKSCVRGTPYGSPDWISKTARKLGLESTLRKPGRPKKQ